MSRARNNGFVEHVISRDVSWTDPDTQLTMMGSVLAYSRLFADVTSEYVQIARGDKTYMFKIRPQGQGKTNLRTVLEEYVSDAFENRPRRVYHHAREVRRQEMIFYKADQVIPSVTMGTGRDRRYFNGPRFIEYAVNEKGFRPVIIGVERVFTEFQRNQLNGLFQSMLKEAGIVADSTGDTHRI